ncbi:hypothetical protein, partial [Bradyrhizobium sp. Leo121]|uniref:hypothetical protein n=1 Tax=Bradyrhizobium sp. Leo121 TaxID=1571195 RepID=UPI001A931AD5
WRWVAPIFGSTHVEYEGQLAFGAFRVSYNCYNWTGASIDRDGRTVLTGSGLAVARVGTMAF